jgi:hypothetical protein
VTRPPPPEPGLVHRALNVFGDVRAGEATTVLLKVAENSTDYTVNNTAKQMLWLPTRREEK